MFYAVVMICSLVEPTCTDKNSIFTTRSDPVYKSLDECMQGGMEHMAEIVPLDHPFTFHIDCIAKGREI